jgi:hypothetical protein
VLSEGGIVFHPAIIDQVWALEIQRSSFLIFISALTAHKLNQRSQQAGLH